VAGGYAAGSAAERGKFLLSSVYAPSTVTVAETFLWYQATTDLRLGVAHLWKQNALRVLGSLRLVRERATTPSLYASIGLQGIGTGNPGLSLTAERNFALSVGALNAYVGVGYRTNERHIHPVLGAKLELGGKVVFGFQNEGHQTHLFVTSNFDKATLGLYLIGGKSLGYMVGLRF
jgi:hypothetical protein